MSFQLKIELEGMTALIPGVFGEFSKGCRLMSDFTAGGAIMIENEGTVGTRFYCRWVQQQSVLQIAPKESCAVWQATKPICTGRIKRNSFMRAPRGWTSCESLRGVQAPFDIPTP